jgi:hypothetical protein
MCECLKITLTNGPVIDIINVQTDSIVNGQNSYLFNYSGNDYRIYFDNILLGWQMGIMPAYTVPSNWIGTLDTPDPCPDSIALSLTWLNFSPVSIITEAIACTTCGVEDRFLREYSAISLPTDFVEQDRGADDCCCEYLVLGSAGSDTWKNDKTSAWIKLSDPTDIFSFALYKNGVITSYLPVPVPFPSEPNAYYTTISWIDVLNSDGIGCYELKIDYDISGVIGSVSWGKYNLKPYTVANALGTARVRALFNGIQETEGINFTNSNVDYSFRFPGFIGSQQPNTETDNIIYGNREMKRVIRENLNTYEINTDPLTECFIRPLMTLFLLSENELFISDYNVFNHSYRYLDLPVIVNESPEITYFDFSRKASLKCKVEDKFKNKRTYY